MHMTYNKSVEPINYPAGNSSAHFKRCTFPRSGNVQWRSSASPL